MRPTAVLGGGGTHRVDLATVRRLRLLPAQGELPELGGIFREHVAREHRERGRGMPPGVLRRQDVQGRLRRQPQVLFRCFLMFLV